MDTYTLNYRHVPLVPFELRNYLGPPITNYDTAKHEGLYSHMGYPMVPITLVGPEGDELQEWGMVDTGSDHTCVPIELMAPLGITIAMCDMEDAEYDGTVTPMPRFTDGIEMRVAGSWKLTFKPHFLPAWRFILLGREDFTSAFKMTLDERAGKLLLEAHPDVERIPDPNEADLAKVRAAFKAPA